MKSKYMFVHMYIFKRYSYIVFNDNNVLITLHYCISFIYSSRKTRIDQSQRSLSRKMFAKKEKYKNVKVFFSATCPWTVEQKFSKNNW